MVHVSIPLSALLSHLSRATGIKVPKRRKVTTGGKKAKKAAKKTGKRPSPKQLAARRKFAAMSRKRAKAAKRKR